jgi:hypothetical protein
MERHTPTQGETQMKLSGTGNRISLTVNGTRCGVRLMGGPWIEGVNPALVKISPKKGQFPAGMRAALVIENNSDGREDYFESDTVRILPGHPLHVSAQALA